MLKAFGHSFERILRHLTGFWAAGCWALLLIIIADFIFGRMTLPTDLAIEIVCWVSVWTGILLGSRRYCLYRFIRASHVVCAKLTADGLTHEVASGTHTEQLLCDALAWLSTGNRDLQNYLNDTTETQTKSHEIDEFDYVAEQWYLPVNALVWCLPALGFLGMASHTVNALDILIGQGLMRGQLPPETLKSIAPSIVTAFRVVILALACSATLYLSTSLAVRAEASARFSFKNLLRTTAQYRKS